jgi:hypothetical protein
VALQLDVKYLWMDSLCITQDDIEDWLKESSVMGDVFINGVCNIAASGSRDPNGGLYLDKPTICQTVLC